MGWIERRRQAFFGEYRTSAVLALLLGGWLCGSSGLRAEDPPPSPEALAWVSEITRDPPGAYRDLKPVRVNFGLSWNNVLNAGELAVMLTEEESGVLVGRAEGSSNGVARALWPYDVEVESRVDPLTLRPQLFQLSETERNKTSRFRLEFDPRRVRTRTVITPIKSGQREVGNTPEVNESTYSFEAINDVLSTALYLRSLDLAKGETVKLLISPFNRPYYVEFVSLGADRRRIKGERYETIRLDVNIRKVRRDKTLQDYEKMKTATIWLSDDEFRLPVEIHADIFVGFVSARMTNREWLEGSASAAAALPGKATGSRPEKKGVLRRLGGSFKAP